MGFGFSITVDPPKFQKSGDTKEAIKKALKIFNAYYRRRVSQRFNSGGPGWAPRRDQSEASGVKRDIRAESLAQHKVKQKLVRQLARARRQYLRGKGTDTSIYRRARVLEEFKKQVSGDASPFFSSDKRTTKSVAGLRDRLARVEKAVAGRVLGRLASSMKSKISGSVLEVKSTIEWSGVHNEGGTAGHGAQIPARPFNYFESIDGEVFAEIVANAMMAALA